MITFSLKDTKKIYINIFCAELKRKKKIIKLPAQDANPLQILAEKEEQRKRAA